MRKHSLILIVATLSALFLSSCKEEGPYEETLDGKTRYTVIGKVPSFASSLIASACIYEYNSSDIRIDSNIISNPSSGTKYVFESNPDATHLKMKLISKENTFRWGDTIVRIIPHNNVNITISPTSPIRFTEPKLDEY